MAIPPAKERWKGSSLHYKQHLGSQSCIFWYWGTLCFKAVSVSVIEICKGLIKKLSVFNINSMVVRFKV